MTCIVNYKKCTSTLAKMAGNVSHYKIILCVTLSKVKKNSEMTTQKTVSNYEKFDKVIRNR